MAQTRPQTAISHEDFDEFEAELPLTFRLRRSWSEADVMELRKASEDLCELGPSVDCADSCELAQDDVSTFDGNDERSVAGLGSEGSTTGDWAEQGDPASEAMSGPPGQWAVQPQRAGSTSFPGFADKEAGPPGNLTKPPGQLGGQCFNFPIQSHGLPGNRVSPANAFDRADLVEQDPSSRDAAAEVSTSPPKSPEPTTLLVSNLPRAWKRSMLVELLGAEGLLMDCDLVYLPVDFKAGIGYGYAFVNFVTHQAARAALEVLDGFADSSKASVSEGALQACWSTKQGLHTHVELYRNSPVMHASVDDDAKPALLRSGARLPFPEPNRALRAPRARARLRQQPDVEANATQAAWWEPLAE